MDYPPLSILIVTFNRKEILRSTIAHLKEHLYYVGPIHYLIADDGSDDGTQAMLAEEFPDAELIQNWRTGMGANSNTGLHRAFELGDYVLQIQDDMELRINLDLHPHIEKLMKDETAGYIRLWGVAGHNYEAKLEGMYWRLLWTCPDLYVASDRPHVKHKRFHDWAGFYPEGLKTAETEEAWCKQTKDVAANGNPTIDVMVPLNMLTETSWEHMGWHDRWRDKGL